MSLLEAANIKKTYTTRFGGNKVEALRNVSFAVEKGEYVAVMGESGSGKTTLLNILAALDKPTGGRIRLEGQDLSELSEKEISQLRRDKLGFVFQDFNLLDTFTLEDNIYLPLVLAGEKHAEMKRRLIPLAVQLGIEPLLKKYPYEVSGGQKQRISIARVFLKNPPIIILDEATSALDTETEKDIQDALQKLIAGRTTIAIAHRLSTLRNATRLVVLDKGTVAEVGTHMELMKKKGLYYELVMAQRQMSKMAKVQPSA